MNGSRGVASYTSKCIVHIESRPCVLVLPRAQISSGSGSACWAKFGFGFHRVFKFQQSSGSGLSGFTSKVRVLGFIGFGFRFYKKMLTSN